jgi:hypothetical protein
MHDNEASNVLHPGRAAFDATAPDRAAVDLSTIALYNLDATYAVAVARAIPARLAPFRATIAALPAFDARHLDRLPVLADALEFAHATLTSRAQRVRNLPALSVEGYQLRTLLLAYGDILALKGRFPADVLARLREGTGYRDLIEDLNALIVLYGERLDSVGNGAPVTVADLNRTREIARLMSNELGADREIAISQDELTQERQKLAHLLLTAHRELRRAAEFIRYNDGDAAALVPSLYITGRGGRTKDVAPPTTPVNAPPTDPEDSPFADDGA